MPRRAIRFRVEIKIQLIRQIQVGAMIFPNRDALRAEGFGDAALDGAGVERVQAVVDRVREDLHRGLADG